MKRDRALKALPLGHKVDANVDPRDKADVENIASQYIDRVIDRQGLASDYACAQLLKISPQAIYKMRAGGAMSNTTAARIGEILEIPWQRIVAECELRRRAVEKNARRSCRRRLGARQLRAIERGAARSGV